MILKLLRGVNKDSQARLDTLINDLGNNPNILWYPSSGNDFRDILEFTNERARLHKMQELPNLHIHTDYYTARLNLNEIVYTDTRTIVQIENKFELQLKNNIQYHINPEYVDFPNDAPDKPTIYLLDITVNSNTLGEIKKPVLYFLFENINFLDEIILKNKISISHLVKVREGCGFGGNRKSISLVYAFISNLKTKYLLVDSEEHTDFKVIHQLQHKHNISPLLYDLIKTNSIDSWSGFYVNVFSVLHREEQLDDDKLSKILNIIDPSRYKYGLAI